MKIMMRDGRVFQGTPKQIVQAMQDIAMPVQHLSQLEYIDWVVDNALRFEAVELKIEGETVEERSASLIAELMRTELCVDA
jgi:hypothetical protein